MLQRTFSARCEGPDIDAITTTSVRAADCYAAGLRELLHGSGAAVPWLRLATEADGHLAIAFSALAISLAANGSVAESAEARARAAATAHLASRRERQHIEIVGLMLSGSLGRARALAAAHLAEFPTDQLIAHLVTDRGA